MKAELARPFSLGVDTVQPLTGSALVSIKHNFTFVIRYLFGRYAIKKPELDGILGEGLAFMGCTPSRAPGWVPSSKMGDDDATKTLDAMVGLWMPQSTIWLDLEEVNGNPTGYVNSWSYAMVSQGCEAGLYVGSNCGLDAEQLWKLQYVTRYWRSCSRVREPANRGFCMSQLRPGNTKVSAVTADINVIEKDFKGGLPTWVVR